MITFLMAKKLKDSGIILNTKNHYLGSEDKYEYGCNYTNQALPEDIYPAPCFAELWDALPEHVTYNGKVYFLWMAKTRPNTEIMYYPNSNDAALFKFDDSDECSLEDLIVQALLFLNERKDVFRYEKIRVKGQVK